MSIKAFAGTVAGAAGEAALSSFFDKLFDKFSSSDLLKTFRKENFDADLRKWKRMLLKIQAVLDDAEEKQVTNGSVKIWLDELEDLAYDVDDILDEFATEALRRELNPEPKSKMQKVLDGYVGSNRDYVKLMRSKIEGINRRLQEIVEEKKDLELRENTGRRPPSTSLVNESRTYGRDEDKMKIVKLLLESSDAQLSVIPIVGMGGLGKTTLAQLVYDEVSRHFELKAWVCVSEDFDNLWLTKEILHSFTSGSCHDNDNLDSLQGKLKNTLSGKKFLLILDDVWNENYELWTELCKPFEFGAQGSKIVVTTRNDGVSSIMGTNPPYKLKELSRDACLRVFTHHALDATDFSEYPELEKYGQKIVDRCNGAPLAAKALGGLLRTKHDPYEWEDVLNSKIWDIPEDKSSIFSVLKLSYNYLPSHLKRCFAYCSLFPKDHEFEIKNLVLLWMAEGLVQETKGKKPMEDLGGDYFRDLLNRSFFQQSSNNESLFVMHDLMHDLAMWAAGDLCYRLEGQLGGSKQSKISTKVRHFSYIKHSNDFIQMFDEDVHLRTFLSPPSYKYGLTKFDVKYCLFPQLRCLRVLSLSGNDVLELPSSIGDLKHLRYLNLSYTKIAILPESTSSLYNLQTLILKGCSHLKKLPEKIENLVNLRHLNISNANSIREMPAGIAKLKSLRTLCFEDMNEWQDWIPCKVECEEFPCLCELSISKCPKLGKLPHHLLSLEKLSIDACKQLVVSIPSHSELQVLKIVGCKEVNVHESVKVEKLIIKNCEELKSLCEDGLMSLVTLEIEIKSCQSLVNIKLKSTLRKLTINDCSALESLEFVIDEGGASSTSSLLMNEENPSCIGNNNASLLEHLEISDCPSLECISSIVDLAAMLKHLEIKKCPNLTSLSSRDTLPTSLKVLLVVDCPKLESIVDKGLHEHLEEIHIIEGCTQGAGESSLSTSQDPVECSLPMSHTPNSRNEADVLTNNWSNQDGVQDLSFESIKVSEISELVDLPSRVHSLKIEECDDLEFIPQGQVPSSPVIKESKDISETEESGECEEETDADIETTLKAEGITPEKDEPNEEDPSPSLFSEDKSSLPPTQGARESSLSTSQDPVECSWPMSHAPNSRNEADVLINTWSNQDGVQDLSFESIKVSVISELLDLPSHVHSLKIEECDDLEFIPQGQVPSSPVIKESKEISETEESGECEEETDADIETILKAKGIKPEQDESNEEDPSPSLFLDDKSSLRLTQGAGESSLSTSQDPVEFSLPMSHTPNSRNEADVLANTWSYQDGVQDLSFESIKVSEISELMDLPSRVHSLKIEECDHLEFIPEGVMSSELSLQDLYIINCCSLKSFPEDHPPTALEILYIRNCKKLNFPLTTEKKTYQDALLKYLCIGSSCDSLKFLSLDLFPNLKSLSIWDCANLESLSMPVHKNLTSFEALEIRDCPNLVSFIGGGLCTPNLMSIWLSNCKKLKKLPEMHTLGSLQSVFINNCPELVSLSEKGLPSRLSLLSITFCNKLELKDEWGLGGLEYLRRLEIEGGCVDMESFPEKFLSSNLSSLRISGLLSLKNLDKGFQKLTTLQRLEISCCPNLRSLPQDGFPSSLSFLCIKKCSLLTSKFRNKKGKDWSKIDHISCIEIDEEVIS